jgi:hypothetical protein
MDWSAISALNEMLPVVTGGDLLVYPEIPDLSTPLTAIRRRNNEGFYERVANFTDFASPISATNGKWVMLHGYDEGSVLFTIDENNYLSNTSYLDVGGFLLSDDTFVGFVYEEDSSCSCIRNIVKSFEYNTETNNWTSIHGTELSLPYDVNWEGDKSSYRASDTHLVLIDSWSDDVTVQIYERQLNRSWSFFESVPINSTLRYGSVEYNGIDTLVITQLGIEVDLAFGIVFIYTKINGIWTEQQFTPASIGYKPLAYLGIAVAFVDAKTLLVCSGLEGYGTGISMFKGGKVLMVTRNEHGSWEPSLDLVSDNGVFGLGVGINDHEIIISSFIPGGAPFITYYATPRCFHQPINVTCAHQQINDCSQLTSTQLYTVNNPQCGAVTASLNGFSVGDNQSIEAQFSFNKRFGPTVYCNATVICPAPLTDTPTSVSGSDFIRLGLFLLLGTTLMMLV